jgi:hypothetical protein
VHRWKLIIFVAALMVGALGLVRMNLQAQDTQARTYYESLNLETPEDAAQTFVDAFQRLDFMTVYFILSPDAQFTSSRKIAIETDKLVRLEEGEDVQAVWGNVPVLGTGLDADVLEHSAAEWFYIFDGLLLEAARHDRLLIDLRGEVVFTGSRPTLNLDEGLTGFDVLATVEGIEGDVIFRMVQAPSGRWRVQQVIVPGGDEALIPWSIVDTSADG